MSNRVDLLTPVGRLVQGSLYEGQTTDAEGKPLTYRTGPQAGQPRVDYYFALAIPKGSETHWSQTEWGAIIWNEGHRSFPGGQAQSPSFAWKIIDGDSTIVNRAGKRPCDRDGYPGHWVLNFSSGFAPAIYNRDGTQQILESNAVNTGDYIQVFGTVSGNESTQQAGVFLNHQIVAFAGYGDRIYTGVDPKAVGFGKAPLPAGVSTIPKAQGFNPAPVAAPATTTPPVANVAPPAYVPPTAPATTMPPVANVAPPPIPHVGILNPPVAPAAPVKTMTAKAGGITYEQMVANGWSDDLLVQHGYMLP